jgi:hypothetical protein
MELLYLKAYTGGYRGCAIDQDSYFFFQLNRHDKVKHLKRYPKSDFKDLGHFKAMMQKFLSPPSFLNPTMSVRALTMKELDRAYLRIHPKIPR